MRIDQNSIADVLLAAPAWALRDIAAAEPHQRERAALELARAIMRGSGLPGDSKDQGILSLWP